MSEPKTLTRKDLFGFYFLWFNFCQQCYNFERLQALGLTFSLIPIIKKLYTKAEERIAALKRHMVFFNTEPFHIGMLIIGCVAALEEKKANGADIDDDAINAVKIGLMGPLAGVGDSWMQGLVWPISLAIGAGLAIEGNFLGPLVFILINYAQMFFVGWNLFMLGYTQGKSAVSGILGSIKFKAAVEALSILGLMVVGAMGAQRVNVALNLAFNVGKSTINIQTILDQLVPSLVPLLAILGVYQLLRKNVSATMVVVFIFILGILGSLLNILVKV